MALLFICDVCKTKWEVDNVNSNGTIVYSEGNKRHHVRMSDPCHDCEEEIEKAKAEVLAKRRKS